MKVKKPNLQQIADRVGMSPATVSRALRDVEGTNPGTRAIVKEAAMQLGYPVEKKARSSRSASDDPVIGVLVHSHRGGINSDFLEGASQAAVAHGARLLFHQVTTEDCGTIFEESYRPRFLETGELDGVILLNHWPHEIVAWLARKYPVVALVHRYGSLVETVGPDDFEAMRMLLGHLAGEGHERVGYVAKVRELSWSLCRYAALVHATCEQGMELCADDVLEAEVESYYAQSFANWDVIAATVIERAELYGTRAWITLSDHAAAILIERLRAVGLRVPEDIVVTGYHGSEERNASKQREISTVYFPSRAMGAAAINRLIHRINTREPAQLSTYFTPSLLVGASTTKDQPCLSKQSSPPLKAV